MAMDDIIQLCTKIKNEVTREQVSGILQSLREKDIQGLVTKENAEEVVNLLEKLNINVPGPIKSLLNNPIVAKLTGGSSETAEDAGNDGEIVQQIIAKVRQHFGV